MRTIGVRRQRAELLRTREGVAVLIGDPGSNVARDVGAGIKNRQRELVVRVAPGGRPLEADEVGTPLTKPMLRLPLDLLSKECYLFVAALVFTLARKAFMPYSPLVEGHAQGGNGQCAKCDPFRSPHGRASESTLLRGNGVNARPSFAVRAAGRWAGRMRLAMRVAQRSDSMRKEVGFQRRVGAERRRLATADEVAAAIRALDREAEPIPVRDWPGELTGVDEPGLYAWWVDRAGASDFSIGTGIRIRTGRIYAGQTGATYWPSGKTPETTLQTRIGSNHLGGRAGAGRIRGSTFRFTLSAALFRPLDLKVIGPRELRLESELKLSRWMRAHLRIAVHPFSERDPLKNLEDQVLQVLDPPLNIDRMKPTALRCRVWAERERIRRGGGRG